MKLSDLEKTAKKSFGDSLMSFHQAGERAFIMVSSPVLFEKVEEFINGTGMKLYCIEEDSGNIWVEFDLSKIGVNGETFQEMQNG